MCKQIISVACLMLMTSLLSAETVKYEYWLDDNYADKVTQETTTEDITLAIDVSSAAPGIHALTFRLTNEDGDISSPQRYLVYLPDAATTVDKELSQYMYWLDDDYANKVTTEVTTEDVALTIDVSSMTPGIHSLTFVAQNEGGEQSAPQCYFVYIPEDIAVANTKLQQYEYWLDNDFAHRVTQEATGEEVETLAEVDIEGLAPGLHFIFLRAQNEDGKWCSPTHYTFFIPETPAETEFDVSYYEYWFDGDYANCERIDVNSSGTEGVIQVSIPDLEPGIHFYHLRAYNAAGMAGPPSTYLVNVPDEPELDASPLVGFRYSFNNLVFDEEMDPSDEFEMADFEFDLPDILDIGTFDEDKCTYTFSETTAKLERTTDVNFVISFVNEEGQWSNPDALTYQEEDVIEHEYMDLVQNEILELDKARYGDFYALKFSITKTGTSYFAADQDCTMEIFKVSTGARTRTFTSEELRAVKSIGLSKGDYYAIVHSMPSDDANPSETVRLLFSSTKQQLIYCRYDVNMDGVLSTPDIECIGDYLLGKQPAKINLKEANVNGNDKVSIEDLARLIELLKPKEEE